MRIEEDGHLALHIMDLKEHYREAPPADLNMLHHFTYEAYIATWYANQAGYRVTFVMPGRLDILKRGSLE